MCFMFMVIQGASNARQIAGADMGVDCRSFNVFVAQELLDMTDV